MYEQVMRNDITAWRNAFLERLFSAGHGNAHAAPALAARAVRY
jgi:hypothetical protein